MANATDPWLLNSDGTEDPFAANVDWHMPDLVDPDEPLPDGDPVLTPQEDLDPEIITTEPKPDPEDAPETMELEDGTTLALEKEKGQWKGVVATTGAGQPQVYWGKTKNELVFNILKAQANATKKIREQNAKLKFNTAPAKPVVPPPPQTTSARELTAEEVFEYNTLNQTNPAAAFDFLMRKTRGLTIDQVLELAQQGSRKADDVSNQLTGESVTKTFLANNPDYYPDPEWSNFGMLVKWLAKFKLGESVKKGEEEVMFNKLLSTGQYTVENLEEAFQDLSEDGLLLTVPRQPKPNLRTAEPPTPVQVQNEPAPAPRPDPRIVSQVTRPRAALGLQRNDVTPVKTPENSTAPSAEDFESLPDDEVSALLNSVRRHRAMALKGR